MQSTQQHTTLADTWLSALGDTVELVVAVGVLLVVMNHYREEFLNAVVAIARFFG